MSTYSQVFVWSRLCKSPLLLRDMPTMLPSRLVDIASWRRLQLQTATKLAVTRHVCGSRFLRLREGRLREDWRNTVSGVMFRMAGAFRVLLADMACGVDLDIMQPAACAYLNCFGQMCPLLLWRSSTSHGQPSESSPAAGFLGGAPYRRRFMALWL